MDVDDITIHLSPQSSLPLSNSSEVAWSSDTDRGNFIRSIDATIDKWTWILTQTVEVEGGYVSRNFNTENHAEKWGSNL